MVRPFRTGLYAFPQIGPYRTMAEVAARAEAMGFDSLWVADETAMAYPGVIGFEAYASLAALARDTSRIALGTLISPPVMRHPYLTAMAATTVDHASNGRFVLGWASVACPPTTPGWDSPM